ncbi:MAG: hypothetical protein ACODAU_13660 [Myxococcota bacterium]
MDFDIDDRTMVAGAPTSVGLRRGDVLAGRYDIRERLRDDAFTLDYRAFDRQKEERVRLREVRPGLLGDAVAVQELLEGLQEVVGTGGAFLPGLADVGQDGPHVYIVEPWPTGMCLSDVFDRRIAQGRTLQPKELLPVVARLEAALSVIPEKWHHGDVRARQVWLDAGHLLLTGAFLLDAMPTSAVAMVLQTNPTLRTYFAPEVSEGWAADAADRYGVAALVWEGLLGVAPPPPGEAGSAVRQLGPLGDVLAQYLAPDPMDRPGTLKPLVEALSRAAGRPAPKLDPAPFRPRRAGGARRRRHDTIPVPPPNFAEAERAKTAPSLQSVPAELRGPARDAGGEDEWDSMPTRQLARRSFEAGKAAAGGAAQAPEDDLPEVSLEEVDAEEVELDLEEIEVEEARAAQPYGPGGAPKAKVPIPGDIKGMPRAQLRQPDAPVTRPASPPGPSIVVDESAHRPSPVPAADAERRTAPAEAPSAEERAPRRRARAAPTGGSSRSVWIVLLAFAAAAAILVASLLVAQMRRQEVEAEKQRRIQERIQMLKEGRGTGIDTQGSGP